MSFKIYFEVIHQQSAATRITTATITTAVTTTTAAGSATTTTYSTPAVSRGKVGAFADIQS